METYINRRFQHVEVKEVDVESDTYLLEAVRTIDEVTSS